MRRISIYMYSIMLEFITIIMKKKYILEMDIKR